MAGIPCLYKPIKTLEFYYQMILFFNVNMNFQFVFNTELTWNLSPARYSPGAVGKSSRRLQCQPVVHFKEQTNKLIPDK